MESRDLGQALRNLGAAYWSIVEPPMARAVLWLDGLIGRAKRK